MRVGAALWRGKADEARLRKVLIGGDGFCHANVPHEHEAADIHERPFFVWPRFQQLSCFVIRRGVNMHDFDIGVGFHPIDGFDDRRPRNVIPAEQRH